MNNDAPAGHRAKTVNIASPRGAIARLGSAAEEMIGAEERFMVAMARH